MTCLVAGSARFAVRLSCTLFTLIGCASGTPPPVTPAAGPSATGASAAAPAAAKANSRAIHARAPAGTGVATTAAAFDDCPRATLPFNQPIAIADDGGVPRQPPISGFPIAFPKGAGFLSLNGFHVTTRDGVKLPAQFEVLSRWGDGPTACAAPIRWAYGWVMVDIDPNERAYLMVRHDPNTNETRTPALTIVDDIKQLVVDTGPARFTIDKEFFNGLTKVEVKSGDAWTTVVETPNTAEAGMLVEREAKRASPLFGIVRGFAVERAGPHLATIAVKGSYSPEGGAQIFRFTLRLSFYAGSGSVLVDHTYYNGAVESDASDGAKNRILTDRVFMRLPLKIKATQAVLRGQTKAHRLAPIHPISIQQDKRMPSRLAVAYGIRHGEQTVEVGTYADRPLLAMSDGKVWALATIAQMGPRDPQALRYDPKTGSLDIDWQSEELFVGGARGIWSKAVLDFGVGPVDLELRGTQAYLHGARPLIGVPNPAYLNSTNAWVQLPTSGKDANTQYVDDAVDKMHDRTVEYLRLYRLTGSQIWPDLSRSACTLNGLCEELSESYYEGGENNYWDWSYAELEQFLRTADPVFVHDFALGEAMLMAETVSWRPDPETQDEYNFAGFSPCYGGGSGWDGPWMEGLNQRRDRCPGDYSYNKVHRLAYILTADRRFTDYFDQGANSVANRYGEKPPREPGQWLEMSASRTTYQYLEQLLNAAEFGRIGGDERTRFFRDRVIAQFEFMRETSLERGHVCTMTGTGFSDPKLLKVCESDQGWMLPVFIEWVARLYHLTGHEPAKKWLMQFGALAPRLFTAVDGKGHPDFGARDRDAAEDALNGWRTIYMCKATDKGIADETCRKVTDVENEGRFYNGGYVAFLNAFGLVLGVDPSDPLKICDWLPDAYAASLALLTVYETNDYIWGKAPGQAFGMSQGALGAMEHCER